MLKLTGQMTRGTTLLLFKIIFQKNIILYFSFFLKIQIFFFNLKVTKDNFFSFFSKNKSNLLLLINYLRLSKKIFNLKLLLGF